VLSESPRVPPWGALLRRSGIRSPSHSRAFEGVSRACPRRLLGEDFRRVQTPTRPVLDSGPEASRTGVPR